MTSKIDAIKKWQENNKEKVKSYKQKWIENNPDYNKKYYKNNRDTILSKNKIWNKENKERMKIYKKEWCENNKGRLIEKCRTRYIDNKENITEQIREYQKSEKGKATRQRAKFKRRTILKHITNTLTSGEWLSILKEYDYRCAYCDVEFEVENMPTKDHIIPISKGGHNTKENIVPACRSCNSKKNNKILNIKEKI